VGFGGFRLEFDDLAAGGNSIVALLLLFLLQLVQQVFEAVMGAKGGEPRIVPHPFQDVEALHHRLPKVGDRFVRLMQLGEGNAAQVPALGPSGP